MTLRNSGLNCSNEERKREVARDGALILPHSSRNCHCFVVVVWSSENRFSSLQIWASKLPDNYFLRLSFFGSRTIPNYCVFCSWRMWCRKSTERGRKRSAINSCQSIAINPTNIIRRENVCDAQSKTLYYSIWSNGVVCESAPHGAQFRDSSERSDSLIGRH